MYRNVGIFDNTSRWTRQETEFAITVANFHLLRQIISAWHFHTLIQESEQKL